MRRYATQMIFLLAMLTFPLELQSAPNTKNVQTLCNGSTYSKDSPFKKSLDYILADLIANTASHGGDYKNISPYPIEFAYGHALSNSSLSPADTGVCLKFARDTVLQVCGNAVGGRVKLVDCYLRYEAYPFSG